MLRCHASANPAFILRDDVEAARSAAVTPWDFGSFEQLLEVLSRRMRTGRARAVHRTTPFQRSVMQQTFCGP